MMQNLPSAGQNREQNGGDRREHPRRDAVLNKLKAILLDNWGMKLTALLIAIALWAGLITRDPTLLREKHFTDVPVNIIGAETLKRSGFIVTDDIEAALEDVSLRVNVPQGNYKAAQASSYSVRIDLSRIRTTGEQEVKILSTNSTAYGTVSEISPASVRLTVDEYVTRYRIPVNVTTQGEVPEGFYATEPTSDPPMVAVSGPKSLVQRIVSVQVAADQSTLPAQEDTVRRALPFMLVDEMGEVIRHDMLEVTNESVLIDAIVVEQTLYTKREVAVSDLGLVVGQPAEGYEVKGVYVTPGVVTIAGRAAAINEMSILYAESNVNVKGLTESVTKSLRVRQPSAIRYASTDQISVAVEIGPIMTTRRFDVPIALQGLPAGLRVEEADAVAVVQLTGPQMWLDGLKAAKVSVCCDLSSITEPGTYTMPLSCTVADDAGQYYTSEISPVSLAVTVIAQ